MTRAKAEVNGALPTHHVLLAGLGLSRHSPHNHPRQVLLAPCCARVRADRCRASPHSAVEWWAEAGTWLPGSRVYSLNFLSMLTWRAALYNPMQ